MKIVLLHLYSNVPTGGEYTYAIHLQDGFRSLNHDCDIVVTSISGREHKNHCNKGFICVKTAMLKEFLLQYDYVIMISGLLKDQDYSFLSDKYKFAFIEHNRSRSFERYSYNKVLEIRPDSKIFCAGIPSIKRYQDIVKLTPLLTRLPFSREIMKKPEIKKQMSGIQAIFPHRMSSVKKPEHTYQFFDGLSKTINWSLDYYGSHVESIILWKMSNFVIEQYFDKGFDKKSVLPYIFKNRQIRLLPCYNPQFDLPKIYSNYNLTVHSTHCLADGARMEYALLESIFYNTPIMSMKKNWVDDVDPDERDIFWIENESYLDMTEENINKFMDEKFQHESLERQQCFLKKYDATEIAAKFIDNI